MDWITEADGVFRGGGVKGLMNGAALVRAALLGGQESAATGAAVRDTMRGSNSKLAHLIGCSFTKEEFQVLWI